MTSFNVVNFEVKSEITDWKFNLKKLYLEREYKVVRWIFLAKLLPNCLSKKSPKKQFTRTVKSSTIYHFVANNFISKYWLESSSCHRDERQFNSQPSTANQLSKHVIAE
jgi:hypothetical protein